MEFEQPQVDLIRTAQDDLRIGRYLTPVENPRCVIIGFPTESGIRIRGGMTGAAEAPAAIRQELYNMTLPMRRQGPFETLLNNTVDLGDLVLTGDLAQDQELLGEVVGSYLKQGIVPIVLGGGQGTTYGHFLGYVKSKGKVGVLAWDAHLDVEPLIDEKAHSGSPIRQILDHPSRACRVCEVAGLLGHTVSKGQADYFLEKEGIMVWRNELTESRIEELYAPVQNRLMVSFDLSAADQAQAPGVGLPSVGGMDLQLLLFAARRAGETRRVASFDVTELCPARDIDGRTARMAALVVWKFLAGLAMRKKM